MTGPAGGGGAGGELAPVETLNPRRWPGPVASVLWVGLGVVGLLLLNVAVDDARDARERERELIANAVTTTGLVVSEEPSCGVRTPARFGGIQRCRIRVEFDVPGEPQPVRTTVDGSRQGGETVTVTYQADQPHRALVGTNLANRIPAEAYMGVVLSLAMFALAVTALRPLPDPGTETELHRARVVVIAPVLFALPLSQAVVFTGLGWGIALFVGGTLLVSELLRRHDRLVIGVDEIRLRRWWRGTTRLVPDQRTTVALGGGRQHAETITLTGPDTKLTIVPRAWQHQARVADRVLRTLSAAGATIPPDVAAHLWALRKAR